MSLVQEHPVCFGCDKRVLLADAVFAPPCCDDVSHSSAVFHGLCLMEWREHRAEQMKRRREAYAAFLQHVNGECGCPKE